MAIHEFSAPVFFFFFNDYFLLLNRNYPERAALKLVGDRYRLSGSQRNCLYRGITSQANSDIRILKRTENPKHQLIHVDGYNVIFTIMNYLLGKVLFVAYDGFLRDSGESYGKIEKPDLFIRSANLFLDCLTAASPERTIVYLDASVDDSEKHRKMIEDGLWARSLSGEIRFSRYADKELLKIKKGIIASSDSEIIDHSDVGIFDLARHCLETTFKIRFVELSGLI